MFPRSTGEAESLETRSACPHTAACSSWVFSAPSGRFSEGAGTRVAGENWAIGWGSQVLLLLLAAGALQHYSSATKSRAVPVDLCTPLRLVQLLLQRVNILLHVKKCSFEVVSKTTTKSQCALLRYVSKALPLPSLTNVTQAVLKLPAGYTALGSPYQSLTVHSALLQSHLCSA